MDKFELLSPVKPFWLTQIFGVDKKTYSRFGINGHNGLDFLAAHGQPIYAAHDGTAYYEVDNDQGHGVVLVSNKSYDNTGYGKGVFMKTIYWHLCDPEKSPDLASPVYLYQKKNKGKQKAVKAGEVIGYADNTGFSTGDHLHFGLKPMVLKKGVYKNVAQDNGFFGAIDPTPFFKKDDKPSFDGTFVSLQKCLKAEGLFPEGVEYFENFGPVTRRATIEFQKKYNIWPPLGNFGPLTKAKIRSLYP